MNKWDQKQFFLETMKGVVQGLASNTNYYQKHYLKPDFEKILAREAMKIAQAATNEVYKNEGKS